MAYEAGKGSRPRPFSVSQAEWDSRWDAIFSRDLKEDKKEVDTSQDSQYNSDTKNKRNNMQVRVSQLTENGVPCGCGRSPTGFCIGWHGLSEEEFQKRLAEHQANQATGE